MLFKVIRNILGDPFLILQSTGMHIDDSGEFADTDDSLRRDVGDMSPSSEWLHVMLTSTVKFDVTKQYNPVVPFSIEG